MGAPHDFKTNWQNKPDFFGGEVHAKKKLCEFENIFIKFKGSSNPQNVRPRSIFDKLS